MIFNGYYCVLSNVDKSFDQKFHQDLAKVVCDEHLCTLYRVYTGNTCIVKPTVQTVADCTV
jgi:hypothetical protein